MRIRMSKTVECNLVGEEKNLNLTLLHMLLECKSNGGRKVIDWRRRSNETVIF
jgi:hypothetical protein